MSAEDGLNKRRAEFVYEAARLAAIAAKAPVIPTSWSAREEAFREQFLKAIERQCGPERSNSPEELHACWVEAYLRMGWKYGEKYDRKNKTHPDIVPYTELGQLERDKDSVFIALCEIARNWIYEREELIAAAWVFDNEGRCRGCGEPIEWWITPNGKKMPMTVKALSKDGFLSPVTDFIRVPHWGECEAADQFRRKK
jgi:RyR domain-containing protein